MDEPDKITFNIPVETKNQFKGSCALNGENMTDVLIQFINNYIVKNKRASA